MNPLEPCGPDAPVPGPGYDRNRLTVGIAHIGVGGFHRAHQAWYLDRYLDSGGDTEWGLCGIGLLPGDATNLARLKQQQGWYCLTEKNDQARHTRLIGSLVRLLHAHDAPDTVIDTLSDPGVRIISLTVTEGGYRFDPEQRRLHWDNPDLQHDLSHPDTPRTLFGYLWQAGRRRARLGDAGRVTLLSCDNVPHNGDVLRQAMQAFIAVAEPDLLPWFETEVSYPNSMVDRITPAPDAAEVDAVARDYGVHDPCALACEPFSQWVIEDRFAAGRPELESVGVQFTDSVDAYERCKLRLLNGSHIVMAYIGYLLGYQSVDRCMTDPDIRRLVEDYMVHDAAPTLEAPPDMPIEPYRATLLARFDNTAIADQQARICSDGYAKLQTYILPLLRDLWRQQTDCRRLVLVFAAFLRYLDGVDDAGRPLTVTEPNLPPEARRSGGLDALALFNEAAFFGPEPDADAAAFLASVAACYQSLERDGVRTVLATVNDAAGAGLGSGAG